MSSIPTQLAETIQTAHIKRDPDPQRDINPATAASEKRPVHLAEKTSPHGSGSVEAEDEPRLRAWPSSRTRKFPPMPDMRFEQSYLHSIEKAGSWWEILFITVKDQVAFPLIQGFAWNMILCGWQHWNRNARIHGNTVGAKLRRWWYRVNDWKMPEKEL